MVSANMLRSLLEVNLGVRRGESVLVLADVRPASPRPVTALAARVAEVARRFARVRFAVYPETPGNGVEPGVPAWRAAFGGAAVESLVRAGLLDPLLAKRATPRQLKRAGAVIRARRADAPRAALFLTHTSITHTKFRALLTDAAGARVASCPGFEARMFRTAMAVSWRRQAARTEAVAAKLNRARAVRVTNPDGSDFAFSVAGRRAVADTGLLTPGRFGNLPAGEAFIAPVEGTARGVLAARSGPEGRFPGGVRFHLARGCAVRVAGGGRLGALLARRFRARPDFAWVAEFGVGTNARARDTNILESEKILGTIHVAFGDNATFGGRHRAPFHQDFLVARPTVLLDPGTRRERPLLRAGKLIR